MAVWYQVEKTEEGLQQFLESNCEFHDYRIERVDYHAAEDYTDVYLAYDTGTEGVLIRFLGMIRLTIPLGRLYAGAWRAHHATLRLDRGGGNMLGRHGRGGKSGGNAGGQD